MRNCFTCQGRFEDRRLICPTDGDVLIDEGKPAPETGDVVGPWRLGNLLGEGGMGRVFEAQGVESGEVVAIKLLRAALSGAEQAHRRFQLEAEAASALEHPGVARIHGLSRTSAGASYIVMERLHGATFDELRRAGKFAAAERVVELLIQICEVLALAHEKGIVHRDLKPSNIYLHREARDRSRVKLLDFGIATFLDRDDDRITSTGEFLGTLLYMAPEQMESSRVTTAADVYSLGVILFEALTGALPFAARSPVELLRLHASQPAPALSTFRPEISEQLEEVVARCLLKKPGNRYHDGGDLAQALRGIPATRSTGGAPALETKTSRIHASHWVGIILDDRYEVQEWVAPSRFGSDVYRAIHLHTGADVAVRLWRTGSGAVRDILLDAFRREARSMAVRHPNLISILDLGINDDCLYMVTELVESISLRTYLARKGALLLEEALSLIRGLADALRALHAKRIISGGMSPEALRLSQGGAGAEKLLLTPLGLANLKQVELLVAPGRDDRSLDYISPEQRAGGEPDARSDLYSLATILLEMLIGPLHEEKAPGNPFERVAPGAGAKDAPLDGLPEGLAVSSGRLEKLGQEWSEFFQRALAQDPNRRYPSAAEFLAEMPVAVPIR